MEAYISDIGGQQIALNSLERVLRRGEIDNLYITMRKNQITIRGFLKLYNEIFRVVRGIVTLKTAQPDEPPAPPPAPSYDAVPPPPSPGVRETPESVEERRARLDRQLAESQRLRDEQDRAREEQQRQRQQQRFGQLQAAFEVAPRG